MPVCGEDLRPISAQDEVNAGTQTLLDIRSLDATQPVKRMVHDGNVDLGFEFPLITCRGRRRPDRTGSVYLQDPELAAF